MDHADKSPTFKCDECQVKEPTVNCSQCESYLCKECSDQIHKHRVFRQHELDVIHAPGECLFCDHYKLCRKDRNQELPCTLVQSLRAADEIKEKIRLSYCEATDQIVEAFRHVQWVVDKVYKAKLDCAEKEFNQILEEFEVSNAALESINSHSVKKICGCENLHKNIHWLIGMAGSMSPTRCPMPVSVQMDYLIDSLKQLLDKMITVQKMGRDREEQHTKPIGCCERIVNTSVTHCRNPVLDSLLRSDGAAGATLFNLYQSANVEKCQLYNVIYNVGFECVMLKPACKRQATVNGELDSPDTAAKLQTYKLKCSEKSCLVLLNCQNDFLPKDLSPTTGHQYALDIRTGDLLLVETSHLVRVEKPQMPVVFVGCIFEPLLRLTNTAFESNIDRCRAVFDDAIFRLDNFKRIKSGRCVLQLTFVKPISFNQRLLTEYLYKDFDDPAIECLQAIDEEPSFLPADKVPHNQKALVVSVRSENCLFAQLDAHSFAQTENNISRCPQGKESVLKHPSIGRVCLCKYKDLLCRSIVVGFLHQRNGESYGIIYYLDYGNIELYEAADLILFRIPSIVNNLPITMKRISLADFGALDQRDVQALRTRYEGKVVNLFSLRTHQKVEVAVLSWVDSRQERVYLRKVDDDDLSFIARSLQLSDNVEPVPTSSDTGGNEDIVVQIYSENRGCVCRGMVEGRHQGRIDIRLIDYGDLLENVRMAGILPCPDDLASWPAHARRCVVGNAKEDRLVDHLKHVNCICTVHTDSCETLWPAISPVFLHSTHKRCDPLVKIVYDSPADSSLD